LQRLTRIQRDERRDGRIAALRQTDVIGQLDEGAEQTDRADVRQQKSAFVSHRRVGLRKQRKIQNGHAEKFKRSVFEIDALFQLVVNNSSCADFPQWLSVAVVSANLTRRIDGALRDCETALAAFGGI